MRRLPRLPGRIWADVLDERLFPNGRQNCSLPRTQLGCGANLDQSYAIRNRRKPRKFALAPARP
jgi:hypothetical protein